jgi:hypothetical protein
MKNIQEESEEDSDGQETEEHEIKTK